MGGEEENKKMQRNNRKKKCHRKNEGKKRKLHFNHPTIPHPSQGQRNLNPSRINPEVRNVLEWININLYGRQ
jgi:hypothetical protein